jgi:hypothetical protein
MGAAEPQQNGNVRFPSKTYMTLTESWSYHSNSTRSSPKYLDVTLDQTLTYKLQATSGKKTSRKIDARVNLMRKLAETN